MSPLSTWSLPITPWFSCLPSRGGARASLASLLVLALLVFGRAASTGVDQEEDDYYDSYEADEDEEEEVESSRALDAAVSGAHREARQSSNAYYDFIITEYSYKIWVVFMIYTMVCVFYACLVAAYLAETNTLAPTQAFDYDYVIKRSAYGEEAASVLDSPPRISPQDVDRVLRAISSTPPPLSPDEPKWAMGGMEKRRRKTFERNSWKYSLSAADPT